jgi:competence protein ComEA
MPQAARIALATSPHFVLLLLASFSTKPPNIREPQRFVQPHALRVHFTLRRATMSRHDSTTHGALQRSVQVLIASLMPVVVAWAGPVDINTADAATIAKELKGIGLSRAQAIVDYREKNGAFKSIDDLRKIKGVGDKTLELNRPNIRFDGAPGRAKKSE